MEIERAFGGPAAGLAWAAGGAALIASVAGLAVPGIYAGVAGGADPATYLGMDAVNLLVLPFMACAAARARAGSTRGELGLLGCLVYYAYGYGYYSFGCVSSPLFFVYLAAFSLSLFALGAIAARGAPARRFAGAPPRVPRVAAAAFLAFAALFTGLAVEFPAYLPAPLGQGLAMRPAAAYVVTDLAILFPAMCAAAWLLLRRRSAGYYFAGVLLVKTAALMPAILAADAINLLRGAALADPSFDALALVFFAGASVLLALYFRGLGGPSRAAGSPPTAPIPGGPAALS